jgi:hypothetical protein
MRYTLTRFGLAVVMAGGVAAAAPAFYWVGWPGAKVNNPPPIVSQTEVVDHRPPPGTTDPPDWTPPGTTNPPGEPPDEPKGIPEPTTLCVAGIGLSVLAVRWWKKRKK